MTHFTPYPEKNAYRMVTRVPAETVETLETFKVVDNITTTSGLARAVGLHKYYTSLRAAGGLLLVQTAENIEPFAPLAPEDYCDPGEQPVRLRVNVNAEFKEYVEPLSDPEDPNDLLGFWHSAIHFYGKSSAYHALDSSFLVVKPHKGSTRLGGIDFSDFYA